MERDSFWDESVEHPRIACLEFWGRRLFYKASHFLLKSKPADAFSFEKIKSILIIKEPYRMGDLLQITPLLRALKTYFPDKKIGLVVQERNFSLFRYNPHLDEIFIYKKREINRFPWKFFTFLRQLRFGKFDLAVTLETERIHLTNDLIAFGSGATFRLRYDGASFGNTDSNIFYNLLVPFKREPAHQVEKNFNVFKPFGLELKDKTLELKFSSENKKHVQEILCRFFKEEGILLNGNFCVIHPGAFKRANRWPLENYLSVAKELKNREKIVFFVLGPSEKKWKERIEMEGIFVLSDLELLDVAALFSLAEFVLCNDTGMMHVASAVGAKTAALFAATDPKEWAPLQDTVTVIQSLDRDISSIKVEQVFKTFLDSNKAIEDSLMAKGKILHSGKKRVH